MTRVLCRLTRACLSVLLFAAGGGWADTGAEVVVDPHRAFGSPIFQRGGARVDDVLERFWAGDSIDALTEEFGVPADQLEDVLRAASRRAA